MVVKMKRYFLIWKKLVSNTLQNAFASRSGVIFFTSGKVLRYVFFLLFLVLIVSNTKQIAGYTLWEVILFFLTFNLIDILSQGIFREVYRFRFYLISGSFDHFLLKPMSPLFRVLLGGLDILDMFTLVPLIGFIIYTFHQLPGITLISMLLYLFLVINGLLITLSFHIFVLGLGVIATEVDNAIWIFRDITYMGRIPVDVYREPVRSLLTFVIPVAAMITFPAKALLGVLSSPWIILAICLCIGFLSMSLMFWKYALRKYTSAGG
jgi:ABC-2 type transport system permease protein